MNDPREAVTRREWFQRCGRRTILAALAALTGTFVVRRMNGECIDSHSPCPSCLLWERCQLPKAAETRQAERKAKQ